jgi:hypothetical protein
MFDGDVSNKSMKKTIKPNKNIEKYQKMDDFEKKCQFIIRRFLSFEDCQNFRIFDQFNRCQNLPNQKNWEFSDTFGA